MITNLLLPAVLLADDLPYSIVAVVVVVVSCLFQR